MSEALDRFEEVAQDYDSFVEKIPKYERITETLKEVLEQLNRTYSPRRVAELGIGTGDFARWVLEQFEPEFLEGIDGAESMIEQCRSRLEDVRGEVVLKCTSFEDWTPDQDNFDWIYSNLSIHHLRDLEKRDLYRRIHEALSESGVFLLSDLVRIPENRADLYRDVYWKRLAELGFDESDIRQRWERHKENDVPSDLRAKLRWLKEIGFGTVECLWKDFNRAIVLASKKSLEQRT